MLVQSPVAGDSRVEREARTLSDAGHEVTVVGRGVPGDVTLDGPVTVLDAGRAAGLGSLGARDGGGALDAARRAARWFLLPEHRSRVEAAWRESAEHLVRDLPADVVHAHDLNTLPLAVREARRRRAGLVYDAHELWSDRRLPGRPTPIGSHRAGRVEAGWASQAQLVLTVSEGIAQVLRARGIPDVRVVRNTFPDAGPPPLLPDEPTGVVYAGRVGAGRDLETLLEAARVPGALPVSLIGPTDPAFTARLRVHPTVRLMPARRVDEVDQVLAEHGIAAITLTGTSRNHLLALPNKLFHAVRAGVPVVAADLPEIRRVVSGYRIGELYTPGDSASLAAAIARVRVRWQELVAAVREARPELRWDADAQVLLEGYSRFAR